ncbi:LysR family transcriptional regulator [Halopolyspora algeriensis]|nr:LysR family transcriptional regulator [Halopolyspora algeriensis]TQM46706.1 DNA-binding transcriptional LysR family regulator [Halopolyspora algeriensis]
MLDVRRMQVLRAVVTSGSVSAAATNLGYTPSAISQQLSALEREAGISLLEKVGRGVRATPAGMLLSERAGMLSELLHTTETELADLRAGRTGLLRVRFFQSASVALIPPAVAKFRAERPEVQLDLRMVEQGALDQVTGGEADVVVLVVGRDVPGARGVRMLHLVDEPYRVVLPRGHPLCDEEPVDLAQLSGESWIHGGLAPGPCTESLTDAFASAGFAPAVAVEADSPQAAQGFVAAGLGVSLLPRLGLDIVHPGVVVRTVRNPEPVRRIYVGVREAVADQPATRALLTALFDSAGT